jgi:pimeloyl-ACP methyl ester carboxylesterase
MANDVTTGRASAQWEARSWVSRDGLNLFYRDYPGRADVPPLLCLHGLTRNSRDFDAFARRYAGRFRIIAPDFRGRGMSDRDPIPARYVPPTYAYDVLQLLDEIGIAEAVFVGTSLGGLVTMLVAAVQPQRIAAAILNDIGPDIDPRGIDRIRSYVGKPVRFRDWAAAAEYIRSINGGLPASNDQDDWVQVARRLCVDDGDGVIFDYDMAIAEPFNQPANDVAFDMWPLFTQLGKTPLLIVRGENSDLLSPETAAKMLDAAPGARLVTVPEVGHAPELTEPAAAAGIDAFLGDLRPAL